MLPGSSRRPERPHEGTPRTAGALAANHGLERGRHILQARGLGREFFGRRGALFGTGRGLERDVLDPGERRADLCV